MMAIEANRTGLKPIVAMYGRRYTLACLQGVAEVNVGRYTFLESSRSCQVDRSYLIFTKIILNLEFLRTALLRLYSHPQLDR